MDQRESIDEIKKDTKTKSSSISDIDQLCDLIDESTFGGCVQGSSQKSSSNLSVRFRSVPSCQVKAFRSSRLKRLHTYSSVSKIDEEDTSEEKSSCRSLVPYTRRTFSMRFSLSTPSLLNRFRSLSTCHFPQSRRSSHQTPSLRSHHIRYPSSTTITLFRTKSILPAIVEEESTNDSLTPTSSSSLSTTTTQSQLSCTIVDTRRPAANSCNVEELAAYLDNFLYLPKSLSGAAELMYT